MFKIGSFSKISNVTVRALHHYEELGLLVPETIDPVSNYRYYSAKQLAVVNQIKMLQQIDLPLKAIKEIIESGDSNQLDYYYELREKEIKEELETLKKKLKVVELFKEQAKSRDFIGNYNIILKEIPQRKVMAIRKTIDSYYDEHLLWHDLYAEFNNQNVKMTTPPFGMTIYYDAEYQETNIDIEVQSNIIADYQDTSEVKFYTAPAFTIASVTFGGSYEQMPEVTQALAAWIEANHYEITGPMINIPYVSPAQDENPENWITEAGFMVTKG